MLWESIINEVKGICYDGDTIVSLVVSPDYSVGGDAIKYDEPFDPSDTETLVKVLDTYYPDGFAGVEIEYYPDGSEIVIWLFDATLFP